MENCEEFYQKLRIPYRIIIKDSAELEILKAPKKKLIAEVWLPGAGIFQSLIYSNSVDCSAKLVKIEKAGYVSSINKTLLHFF